MSLKNRLIKLEQALETQNKSLCVLIQFDDKWTLEQKKQLAQAESAKHQIIIVNFV
ncbi:hypothetical protein [uncultured Nitrosomonas sp.]|uniref:hypothetical protein n=1 Tax=uncultured Nitrosomonas sp. TaxID=156424 RepID=UPI0025F5B4BE|nr:hypothetical protein [uncultured Nitrosomonas sp.]